MKCINDLSDDDLSSIFSRLDLRSKGNCELVCQRWLRVVRASPASNYAIKVTTDLDPSGTKRKLSPYSKFYCENGKHVISEEYEIKDAELGKQLLKKHHKVTAICVEIYDEGLLMEYLQIMAIEFTCLEHLEIRMLYLANEHIRVIKSICRHSLKHLSFWSTFETTYHFPTTIHVRPPVTSNAFIINHAFRDLNVESLFINCSYNSIGACNMPSSLTALGLQNKRDGQWGILMTPQVANLTKLYLLSVDADLLRSICREMRNLKTLLLERIIFRTLDQLTPLRNLRGLIRLQLGLPNDPFYRPIQVPNLEIGMDDDSDEEIDPNPGGGENDKNGLLLEIMSQNADLKWLELNYFGVSDQFLTRLSRLCPILEELAIVNVKQQRLLSDPSLDSLSDLKCLHSLTIPVGQFTGEGIRRFLSGSETIANVVLPVPKSSVDYVVNIMKDKALRNPRKDYSLILSEYSDLWFVNLPSNLRVNDSLDAFLTSDRIRRSRTPIVGPLRFRH